MDGGHTQIATASRIFCDPSLAEYWGTRPLLTRSMDVAVSCIFNDGFLHTMKTFYEKLGLDISRKSVEIWEDIDIASAEYHDLLERKERRKARKRELCKKEDAFQKVEGDTYKSNAFY